ncbi:TldD/PmbA family protein [Anaeropeptidivorans aminofermentans]|uniref:TldD/PmbA family protein n=1 Tax=Anaeropeptidivorans aminofermentans TaxID=2934315 RepID=UPI0020252353|nr:TldD/PmbA family protein [Anaeropeptidivorans aminofermentans]
MLRKEVIERILSAATERGADYGEVFLEDSKSTSIQMNNNTIESGVINQDYGIGIRIFSGLDNIYTYTNDLREENLIKMTRDAAATLKEREKAGYRPLGELKTVENKSPALILPTKTDYSKKIDLLKNIVSTGNQYDEKIKKITVNYYDGVQNVIIANTDGLYAEDQRVKTRVRIGAMAENKNNVYMGYRSAGAMKGFEFYENADLDYITKDSCRMAIAMLDAKYAPAGRMSVIADNGFGGLLFHEACGHSLEASFVSKGTSEFCGKLGTQVASPILTLIDDGSMPGMWGSLNMDDEGTPTQRNVLIEKGILKGYMVDRLNGKRMGMNPTGSSRRQNYRFAPTSRMTNTYIMPGESKKEDMIANTERGIFVSHINAGSVDPLTGEFNFSTLESYMVENGKITYPIKGASLIGTGINILKQVDMVGNNLEIGDGFCFAGSGALFICAGQPTVRVNNMTIGGVE